MLKRQIEQEEKVTGIDRTIPVFPWEGARALKKAMEEKFGIFTTQNIRTMFGEIPPKEITINTDFGKTEQVLWGHIQWPLAEKNPFDPGHVKEYISTSVGVAKGRLVFKIEGQVKQKWMPEINALIKRVEEIISKESLYRGKAVRIAFTDADGELEMQPEPEFLDLSKFTTSDVVYSRDLEQLIDTYVMTPLKHTQACRDANIPLGRGILAAGPYGTGKSLLAQAVGKVGVENGWTFLYIKNAAELPHAIRFGAQYEPCVIFAEDIDRATEGEERTEAIDEILNTLDGIDTKKNEIMVILTTNHLDTVNPAMRRPGRLDVVLNITAPDSEAATRLVHLYGRGLIAENTDLAEVGKILEGQTPAVIREVVERSKMAAIGRTGRPDSVVLAQDLRISAIAMVEQNKLLAPQKKDDKHWSKGLMDEIRNTVQDEVHGVDMEKTIVDGIQRSRGG